jgi:hypothetical protein
MRCEYCNKVIRHFETANGIKHGVIRSYPEEFVPSRDSAWTVICNPCSEMLLKLIYAKLNKTSINPAIRKTYMQTR